jgi:hypothetical protein
LSDLLDLIKKLRKGESPDKKNTKTDDKKVVIPKLINPFSTDVPTKEQMDFNTQYPQTVGDVSTYTIAPQGKRPKDINVDYKTVVTDEPITDEQAKYYNEALTKIQEDQKKANEEPPVDYLDPSNNPRVQTVKKMFDAGKESLSTWIGSLKKLYTTPIENIQSLVETGKTKDSPSELISRTVTTPADVLTGSMGLVGATTMLPIDETLKTVPYIGKFSSKLANNVFGMIDEAGQMPVEMLQQSIEKVTGIPISEETRKKLNGVGGLIAQMIVGEKLGKYLKIPKVERKFAEEQLAKVYAEEMYNTKWDQGPNADIYKIDTDAGLKTAGPEAPPAIQINPARQQWDIRNNPDPIKVNEYYEGQIQELANKRRMAELNGRIKEVAEIDNQVRILNENMLADMKTASELPPQVKNFRGQARVTKDMEIKDFNTPVEATTNPINLENITPNNIQEGYIRPMDIANAERELHNKAFNNLIAMSEGKPVNITREMIQQEIARMQQGDKPVKSYTPQQIATSNEITQVRTNENIPMQKGVTLGSNSLESVPFNYEKFNAPEDVLSMIDQVAEKNKQDFDVQRRGSITNAETLAKGNELAGKINQPVDLQPGIVYNAEQTTAIRQLMTSGARQLVEEAQKLLPDATYDQLLAFKEKYIKFVAMAKSIAGLRTEAGRLLNSWKIPVDGDIQVMNVLSKELKRLSIDDPNLLPEVQKLLAPSLKDKAFWAYYNTILSSPFTDIANILGNTTHLIANGITLGISNPLAIGNILKSLKSKLGEGLRDINDIYHGKKQANSKFSEEGPGGRERFDLSTETRSGRLFKIFTPTTRLAVQDAFFRRMFEGLRMGDEITRQTRKGSFNEVPLKFEDIYAQVNEVLNNPLSEFAQNPLLKEIADGVATFSEHGVFQTPLKSGLFRSLQNPMSGNWDYVIKFLVPFVKTPANIIKVGLENSPLGFMKLLGKEAKNLTRMERLDITRRAVMGSTVMSGLLTLMANGNIDITGTGNFGKKEKQDLLEKSGWRPNSIIINWGDGTRQAISFQNVNPFNIMLGVIGNISDEIKYGKVGKYEGGIEKVLTNSLFSFAYSLTDMSMLKGIASFIQAIQPDQTQGNFLSRTAENIIAQPFAVPQTAIDYYRIMMGEEQYTRLQYQTEKLGEQFRKRVGLGWESDLTPQRTIMGEHRRSLYERFPIGVMGLNNYRANKLAEILLKNNITWALPQNTYSVDKEVYTLEPKEYDKFLEETGKEIWKRLQDDVGKIEVMKQPEMKGYVSAIVDKVRSDYRKKNFKGKKSKYSF